MFERAAFPVSGRPDLDAFKDLAAELWFLLNGPLG